MTDNIDITPGSGKTVVTDDAGAGGHVQIVKLAIGTDGSATVIPADATNGLKVDVARIVAVALDAATLAALETTELGASTLAALETIELGSTTLAALESITVGTALPAGTNNIGDVDLASAIPAGNNNIGDVDIASALPAGTNAIGKLAANSGVDIGDVDVTSLPALPSGTNTVGGVNVKPATSGGLSVFHLVSAGSTNATNVKASAGQLFGYYIYNSNAAARKVAFHNTAGTPTAGASVLFSVTIPATSAANVEFTNGIAFGTGIGITTVTGLADSDATAVAANDLGINLFYA